MSLSAILALIRGDQPSFEYVAQGFEEGFDLAAASDGDILQFDSGAWEAVSFGLMFAANRTTSQSIANNTRTTVIYNNIVIERNGVSYNDTNGEITISLPGWYFLSANVRFSSNSTGVRTAEFDDRALGLVLQNAVSGGTTGYNLISRAFEVGGSPVVRRVRVEQTSGGSLNLEASGDVNSVSLYRLL
jgi:hypothetical protein